jgi:hypothetical protein
VTKLTIIPEATYSDIEHDFIENEPPGLFPSDQTSVWGQSRKVFSDHLQGIADTLAKWYGNLDPRTVSDDDLPEWEYMLDLPAGNIALSPAQRKSAIVSRFTRGPFTRTRRKQIVESFIAPTFGAATLFSSAGIPLDATGVSMFSGSSSIAGTYLIIEDIPNFAYKVYVLTSLSVDVTGLTRELTRITPAGIAFTVLQVVKLPMSGGLVNATSVVSGRVAAKKLLHPISIAATATVGGTVTKV